MEPRLLKRLENERRGQAFQKKWYKVGLLLQLYPGIANVSPSDRWPALCQAAEVAQ